MASISEADRVSEREAWIVLSSAAGLGPAGFARLLRRHGTARTILEIASHPDGSDELVAASRGIDSESTPGDQGSDRREWLAPEVGTAIADAVRSGSKLLDRIAKLKLDVVLLDDPDYPQRLLATDRPPVVLYLRGHRSALASEHPVAVVGTRRATQAGLRTAALIAGGITAVGGLVISGLALGIDGAAHQAAVDLQRPTVAVLGSGLARLYPSAHHELAEGIIGAGGCLVSELPPDMPGSSGTFPMRNRIISGMSDATVVIEAPHRSGALITADWAMQQGRDCYLVPGALDATATVGSLHYLRGYHDQARIVASLPLLLEDLGFNAEGRPGMAPAGLALGATETAVAELVVGGESTVDRLAAVSGFSVSTLLSALTLLEMRGLVVGAYGRYRPSGALAPSVAPRRRRSSARASPTR
jgi:DNA processing protein